MGSQFHMIWPEGLNGPKPVVPDGYTLRPMVDADEAGHIAVMQNAGFESWSQKQLDEWKLRALPEGIIVMVDAAGAVAATAMASHRATALHPWGGELGWVAANAAHAGRGLGAAVCAAALGRFLDAGYRHIYLMTDDWRRAAIKTYLKLGFVPFLFADGMEERWKRVCEQLKWPVPDAWPRAPEHLWISTDPEDRPDLDKPSRYAKRFKWLPAREHRGFSCNGDVDAFGDESLYHPSQLGSATVSPTKTPAGGNAPLKLTYTAGVAGLPTGAKVTFVIRGQHPLGMGLPMPTVSGPPTCKIEPIKTGFILKQGSLVAGAVVTLDYVAFCWTPLSGRREIKVVIHYADGIPEQRLPEPLVVNVLPGPVSRIEATVPCTRRPGEKIRVQLTARDAADNRVPCRESVTIGTGDAVQTLEMVDGLASMTMAPGEVAVARVEAAMPALNLTCQSNPCVVDSGLQLYVGDLHGHDFLSEAEGYPDEVYRWAIEDRRMDFVSVVPQSHGWHDNETWTVTKYMNERFLREGEFVPFLGFEWQQTGYGDKVVHYLGGDQPFLPVDDPRYRSAAKLYAALRGSDALVISHHPCYPRGSWCSNTDFDAVETDVERLVELWSMHGSSEGYDPGDRPFAKVEPQSLVMAALKRGVRLGFTGGSDTHSARPGGSAKEPLSYWGGLTGIWAESLTRRDLFRALYQRRTYALTQARIVLRMTVNGAPMGAELPAADEADIAVSAWAPVAIAKIEILKNAELLHSEAASGDQHQCRLKDLTKGPAFYHCRVTLADGNLAVCSPVWLG